MDPSLTSEPNSECLNNSNESGKAVEDNYDAIEQEMRDARYRLGSDEHHEVYKGECIGTILAFHLAGAEERVEAIS